MAEYSISSPAICMRRSGGKTSVSGACIRPNTSEPGSSRSISFFGNQEDKYLESEEQKLSFFCDQLGIDKKILPHKRYSGAIKENFTDHYFVDKFPMYYNPAASLAPVVTFSFIDPGFESMDSFRTHLDAYLNLFTKLQSLNFRYIATRDTNFERAKKVFHGTFQRLWNPDGPSGLLHYFHTRRTWDEKNYGKLSNDDIAFINEGKERFGSPELENLTEDGARERSRKTRCDPIPSSSARLRR